MIQDIERFKYNTNNTNTDMVDVTVSLRVDKSLHEQMKLHDEINWSAMMRNSIAEQLDKLERIDAERAKHAAKQIDELRKTKAFDKGKTSVEIIREWRGKRR